MIYYINKNEIHFITPYNFEFIHDIKEIIGRKYDLENKRWYCPISVSNIDEIKILLDKYKFKKQGDSQDLPNLNINVSETEDPSYKQRLISLEEHILSLGLTQNPRPYQLPIINFLIKSKKCIDGSDMGVGKTLHAIFTVEAENLFPCLVITPASIKYNWRLQWRKTNNERTVSVIDGKDLDFSTDVVIINYDILGKKIIVEGAEQVEFKYEELKDIKWKSVICDESQKLKNSKSIRAKIVKKICKKVENIYFATGTLVLNRPAELISPMEILGKFTLLFGNWRNFVYKYCDAKQTRFGLDYTGAHNTKELNSIISKNCYVRVEKRDVLKDLPELQETIAEVDIDNRKEYNKAESDLISYLRDNYGEQKAISAEAAEHLVMINVLRQLSVKGKLVAISEHIDLFLESCDRKLVVFGVYTDSLEILSKVYKCPIITGQTPIKKRQSIVENFQVDDNRMLVMNIQAGGVGIDGLQNICSDMIIIELPWTWTDISQVIARLERSGQLNSIFVKYILGVNTIDMYMWDILNNKRNITDSVNKGVDSKINNNIMKELLDKFR